jgi:hypothetical protein
VGKNSSAYKVSAKKPERKRQLSDLSADERVILEWSFKKYNGMTWIGTV